MLTKVLETIDKYQMLGRDQRVVVGASGGPDSTALLHLLWRLSGELGLDIYVAHLHHGLRGEEAERDLEYVRALACDFNLPLREKKVHVLREARAQDLSVEEAGREARYNFFGHLAREVGAERVAVGHHADDQVETLLMRLIRGAGLRGLRGIPPVRSLKQGPAMLIRPLIEIPRPEIEQYLKDRGLQPKRDSSNRDPSYLRNRIRHHLIPLLEQEFNPGIRELLWNTTERMRVDSDFMDRRTDEAFGRLIVRHPYFPLSLDKEQYLGLHRALQTRLIRRSLTELTGGQLSDLSAARIDEILDLITRGKPGNWCPAGGEIRVYNDYELIHFTANPPGDEPRFSTPVVSPGLNIFTGRDLSFRFRIVSSMDLLRSELPPEEQIREHVVKKRNESHADLYYLDWERVSTAGRPLIIRNRRPGDVVHPLGMEGKKKLKDFFIDRKVSRYLRDRIPLIVSGRGQIIVVAGLEIAHPFRVTATTKTMLTITVEGDV